MAVRECFGGWVSDKMSAFATVQIKRAYLILPNAYSDNSSNYQLASLFMTASRNDHSMYGFSAVDFMTDC